MKPQVKNWLDFAEKDIRSAEKLSEDEYLTQSAAFHCHQAVEKVFKAILENNEQKIPRIHNLEVLCRLSNAVCEIALEKQTLKKINEVYIDSRYPGDVGLVPSGSPSMKTIQEFLDFIHQLYNKAYLLLD